jgi:phage FluMu gp28-like protein
MNADTYFFKSQADWIRDESGLLICEKGRQLGFSYAHSYKITRRAAKAKARDEWVMSRDEIQAKQFILYCKRWAKVLSYAATDHGEQVLTTEDGKAIKVQVLTFASGPASTRCPPTPTPSSARPATSPWTSSPCTKPSANSTPSPSP